MKHHKAVIILEHPWCAGRTDACAVQTHVARNTVRIPNSSRVLAKHRIGAPQQADCSMSTHMESVSAASAVDMHGCH